MNSQKLEVPQGHDIISQKYGLMIGTSWIDDSDLKTVLLKHLGQENTFWSEHVIPLDFSRHDNNCFNFMISSQFSSSRWLPLFIVIFSSVLVKLASYLYPWLPSQPQFPLLETFRGFLLSCHHIFLFCVLAVGSRYPSDYSCQLTLCLHSFPG